MMGEGEPVWQGIWELKSDLRNEKIRLFEDVAFLKEGLADDPDPFMEQMVLDYYARIEELNRILHNVEYRLYELPPE